MIDVLNVAYDVRERRPWWKYRLVALGLTVGLAFLVIGGAALFTFGSLGLGILARELELSGWLQTVTLGVNYIVGLAMLFLGVSALYYFGPNVQQRWKFLTPGAIVGVGGVLLASFVFSVYIQHAPSYNAIYGGLGAVVIFMLWLYLISLMLLVGAEVNDEVAKGMGERIRERE
jgi:membrane protein